MPVRKLRCLDKCVFTRVVYFCSYLFTSLSPVIYFYSYLFTSLPFASLRSLKDLFIYLIPFLPDRFSSERRV